MADGLVKTEVGRATAADMGVDALGKHSAEEEGIVGDENADKKRLFGRRIASLGQEIGDVDEAARSGVFFAGRAQLAGVGKGEEHGGDVVGEGPFVEGDAPQNAAGEDIEIKRGGDLEAAGLVDDGIVDEIVIEDGVAFGLSLKRETRETASLGDLASTLTTKEKSSAVNCARQFA